MEYVSPCGSVEEGVIWMGQKVAVPVFLFEGVDDGDHM
jgi:hypothetical protein